MKLSEILDLSNHGPDTYVGRGPQYPWGGLYGGQIVAQALYAAALTVDDEFGVHSLRAYFIRRGDHDEPVRYEVDRIRNGRTFCTRRVVARQAIGAILNLEASFQVPESSAEVQILELPAGIGRVDDLVAKATGAGETGADETGDSWSPVFDRRFVPAESFATTEDRRAGRVAAWMRVLEPTDGPLMNACGLAYLSDDLPTDAVVRAHPIGQLPESERWQGIFSASLDHAIWFHRPAPADAWNLHDFSCLSYGSGRGLTLGKVFTEDGLHVATIAQEVLLRDGR